MHAWWEAHSLILPANNGIVLEVFRPSHSERFTCCALTIQYIICSTVGRSIASKSDLGKHIYFGASCLSKYGASVVRIYRLWTSLLYYIYYIYIIYILCIQGAQTTTTQCSTASAVFVPVVARKTPPAHVAECDTTTCASGVFVPGAE